MLHARLGALLLFAGLFASGCGSDRPAPVPDAVKGSYTVDIEANGKTDADVMTATVGSNSNILLTFAAGISEVRCTLYGSTDLELPRQALDVAHSTGEATGSATGGGTISASGAVDLTIHLTTIGFVSDAGAPATVDYHITGQKM